LPIWIADHLETFLAALAADPDAPGLPAYVQREFYAYLQCGILAHGFLRLGCDTCPKELLLPFSCKRRGFCPSCAARRMAQTAAHRACGGHTRPKAWVRRFSGEGGGFCPACAARRRPRRAPPLVEGFIPGVPPRQ